MGYFYEKGRDCLSGHKRINGRKRFTLTDVLGLLLALVVTPAHMGERAGALLVLARLGDRFSRLQVILADQGFDEIEFIAQVKSLFGLVVEVVCQVLGGKGFQVVPKGWIVECTFGWFSFHRRLSKDYS